jgi:hypothetical protein
MSYKTFKLFFISTIIILFTACGDETKDTKNTIHTKSSTISSIHISEILSANTNTNYDPDFKEFSDWIELYNDSNESKDISGYYLSDSKKNTKKWTFPNNTNIKAFGYLLIWADAKVQRLSSLHTNFKLSQDGERVILSDQDGVIIDKLKYSSQERDISCAKIDGNIVYMNPTPNAKNSKNHERLERSKDVEFLLKSGFYAGEQIVELEADGDIYYTLDGSHPTTSSKLYNSPIIIDKTTVIRAISIEDGKFESLSYAQTYLIDEDITLPVMSISMDEKYLYDDEIGIYKNYSQDWMRAANVEFIKDGESKFSEGVGVKIHGAYSRQFPQKSFSIFLKDRYGSSSLKYPLFVDKPQIEKVKSFILRNGGYNWKYYKIRDGLSHKLASKISDIDYLSYESTIVYINGKYLGILNLREKPNKDYIIANHNLSKKEANIDLIKSVTNSSPIALSGNLDSYNSLIKFIKNNDLSNKINYDYIKTKVDINEFTNYLILEQFIGNGDWPYQNIKSWKSKTPNSKWRWILYDTDAAFQHKKESIHIMNDIFLDFDKYAVEILKKPTENLFSCLYKNLLKNEDFKNTYLSKFNILLDSTFSSKSLKSLYFPIKENLEPEIKRNTLKWQSYYLIKNDEWEDAKESINALEDYIEYRAIALKIQLNNYFNQ